MAIRIEKDGVVHELAAWQPIAVSNIIGVLASRGKPALPVTLNGWALTEFTPPDTRAAAAGRARERIAAGFAADSSTPVDAAGYTWKGGEASAVSLDRSVRMSERAGSAEVLVSPLGESPFNMPIADAIAASLAIAGAYTTAYIKKGQKDAEIQTLEADPDSTIAQFDAVVW